MVVFPERGSFQVRHVHFSFPSVFRWRRWCRTLPRRCSVWRTAARSACTGISGRGMTAPCVAARWVVHLTHLCQLDSPILLNWVTLFPNLGMSSMFISICRIFLTEIHLSKQRRPWWDAASFGVSSGSTLFGKAFFLDARHKWVNLIIHEPRSGEISLCSPHRLFIDDTFRLDLIFV